jgi:hypothetical protein
MNNPALIAEGQVSLWFVMLSPVLGILVGMLAVFRFS